MTASRPETRNGTPLKIRSWTRREGGGRLRCPPIAVTFDLKSRDYLDQPERKRLYNERLFEAVAPRYHFITRALSLGRDAAWKRQLVALLPDLEAPRCLDLACGTGDLTLLVHDRFPGSRVTGLDLTPAMIDLARTRRGADRVTFAVGDMTATGLPDASLDLVTGGYALRNAPDLERALREIHRILRPGGIGAFLDFSKPAHPWGQAITHAVLKTWGGFWGLLVHRNAEVYAYIAESLRRHPDRAAFRRLLGRVGFRELRAKRYYLGLLETIVVEKAR